MSNQLDLKQEIQAEKKKFKTLSFAEKINYIKDYYSIHILAVLILVVVAVAVYHTYQEKNYDTELYVALINNDKSVWDEDIDSYEQMLSNGFAAHLGIDNDKKRVEIDNNYTIDYERDPEMSAYSAESLVAMIYGAHVDILLGDQKALDYFCDDEGTFFFSLDTIFDAQFLEKYKDRIVYYTPPKGNGPIPMAIDVTDCPYIQDAGLTLDQVFVTIFANTKRPENSIEYIRFILQEQ